MIFKPKLMISEEETYYADRTFDWFIERFGGEYLHTKKAITPEEFFTNGYKGDENDFKRACNLISEIMDIDPRNICFQITVNNQAQKSINGFVHSSVEGSKFAGLYENKNGEVLISIEEDNLTVPMMLVAVISHELSHYKLLHQLKIMDADEYLTDIMPTFYGFGIFTSSSVNVISNYNTITGSGWTTRSAGYHSEYFHGYMLAK